MRALKSNQSKKQEVVYIYVAQIYIRLIFGDATTAPVIKERLKRDILKTYSEFIVYTIPDTVHFTIEFVGKNINSISLIDSRVGYVSFFRKSGRKKIISYYHISITQFQFLLAEVLIEALNTSGLIIHASANLVNNKAVIFSGPSGVGKSTVMTMLNDVFPALADDIVIIKKEGLKFFMYQTPTYGREWWIQRSQKKYEIRRIFFLRQFPRLSSLHLTKRGHVLPLLMHELWIKEKKFLKKQVSLLANFVNTFDSFYELQFPLKKAVVVQFIQKITKEKVNN